MGEVRVRRLQDADAVMRAAADRFVARAREATARSGRFTVALAGGSTPRALYRLLAGGPDRGSVSWENVDFFFGDERAVPPDHPDSNYRMARETLFDPIGAVAERVHRMRGELPDLEAAAGAYQAELARVFGVSGPGALPAFDLVLLGLGADAHTASLFPATAALDERGRWVAANEVPVLSTSRLTLTPPVLNAAAEVHFLVTGETKAAAVASVLEGPRDPHRFPAQLVEVPHGMVTWFIDGPAARELRHG